MKPFQEPEFKANMFHFVKVDGCNTVEYAGQRYHTMHEILAAFPCEVWDRQLSHYCRLLTFLSRGNEFLPIGSISDFQRKYQHQLEVEAHEDRGLYTKGSDFGPFDVSAMHEPMISDGVLLFFVEDTAYGIPYKVTSPYPMRNEDDSIVFSLLPFAEQA